MGIDESLVEEIVRRILSAAAPDKIILFGSAAKGRMTHESDPTIQGNIKGPASITEPLQLALESRAVKVIVPVSKKAQFAGLPQDVIERLDVVFYGDVDRAVLKTLEM